MRNTFLCLGVLALLLAACQEQKPTAGDEVQATRVAPAQKAAAATAAAPATPGVAPGHKAAAHDCAGGDVGAQLLNDKVTTTEGPGGQKIVHAGNAFSKDAATVTVADLLANPDAHQGKKVQIKGNVSAMCSHSRGWFAVAADDKSGTFVRVLTRPVFLVPAGSVGKLAQAEGTVEVLEVNQETARHFAKGHKLGDPKAIQGVQKRIVLRATGAEFI